MDVKNFPATTEAAAAPVELPSKGKHGSGSYHVLRIDASGCCVRDCGDLLWNGEVIGPDSTFLVISDAAALAEALSMADPTTRYACVWLPLV